MRSRIVPLRTFLYSFLTLFDWQMSSMEDIQVRKGAGNVLQSIY